MSLYGDEKPEIGKKNPFENQENVIGDVYFRDGSGMFKLENLKWKKLSKTLNAVYDYLGVGSYAKDSREKAYEAKPLYDAKDEEKQIGTVLLVVPIEKRFADQQKQELEELEKEEKQKATIKKTTAKKSTAKKSSKAKPKTVTKAKKSAAVTKKVTAKKATVKKTITKSKTVKKAKRPLNAYMRFAKDERKKIVKSNPKMCITDVARELGKRYQKLTDSEKNRYKSLAEKEFSK